MTLVGVSVQVKPADALDVSVKVPVAPFTAVILIV